MTRIRNFTLGGQILPICSLQRILIFNTYSTNFGLFVLESADPFGVILRWSQELLRRKLFAILVMLEKISLPKVKITFYYFIPHLSPIRLRSSSF